MSSFFEYVIQKCFHFIIFHTLCICTKLHKILMNEVSTNIFLPYSCFIFKTKIDLFKNYFCVHLILECNIPLGSTYFLFNFLIHIICLSDYSFHLILPHILCILDKFENNASSFSILVGQFLVKN